MNLEFIIQRWFTIPIICFTLILFLPISCANSYYADLTIVIDPSGFVTIEGHTNYPNLLVKDSQNYTSKNQSYWLFNISIEENFSEFVYTVILPKGSSINYIKSSGVIKITEEQGNLVVKGYGENKKLSIVIQYQFERSYNFAINIGLFTMVIITVVILAILFFLILYRNRYLKEIEKGRAEEISLKGLNERQKQIVKLLMEANRALTQTDIQKQLKIPKAAVSRNIRSLERKGLIEKEKIGMSNLISLRKQ